MKNIVTTHWENVPGMDHSELEMEWRKSWARYGWIQVVTTKQDIVRHPEHQRVMDHIKTLPTLNNREYEDACYLRWLAGQMSGSRLFVDMDCINRGFTENDLDALPQDRLVMLTANACPCAAYITSGFPIWELILQYTPEMAGPGPHCSDQSMFERLAMNGFGGVVAVDICRQFDTEGWENAKLAHYSTSSVVESGKWGGNNKALAIRSTQRK